MRPTHITKHVGIALQAWAVLLCALTGCNDFSQRYLGGLRKEPTEDALPKTGAGTELAIRNAPMKEQPPLDSGVKQATYSSQRDPSDSALPSSKDPGEQLYQHPMHLLYTRAAQRYATMESYIFRLRRREVVSGEKKPEELLEVKVRQQPFSVYLKWLGNEAKGREVIYVQGKYDNKMQVLLEPTSVFALLGRRKSVAPNDALARSSSRHPITDTGFGSLIESYGRLVTGIERGDPRAGTAKCIGRIKRPEFLLPVNVVHQTIPPGSEPLLPKGGQRYWYFDPLNGLPVLYITEDTEREVEYYCHDNIQSPVHLDDDDFNPDRLWK